MKHTYLKSVFLAMLIPFLGFSQEHYPVGTRPKEEKPKEASSSFYSNAYPMAYFPLGMHCLLSVSAAGYSLDIEDGSRWQISPTDAPKLASWGSQDPLIITQNHNWFSNYNYRIINHATGSTLYANLANGPIKNGPYTHYIQSVNSCTGEIVLNDLTSWQVSFLDQASIYDWYINDAVIIGYNSGWDTDCQGLLINVTKKDHVRAAQF
jgi:hypothetical protein